MVEGKGGALSDGGVRDRVAIDAGPRTCSHECKWNAKYHSSLPFDFKFNCPCV